MVTTGYQLGPQGCNPKIVFIEIPDVACGLLVDADYNSLNGSYDSTNGIGKFYGGNWGGAIRGGDWGGGVNTGIYFLLLNYTAASSTSSIGFRCVFRP